MRFVQLHKGLWLLSMPQPMNTYRLAMHFSICTSHPNPCMVDAQFRSLVCFKCYIVPILCVSINAAILCLFCGRNEKSTLQSSMFIAKTLLVVTLALCTESQRKWKSLGYSVKYGLTQSFFILNQEKQTQNSDRNKCFALSVTVSLSYFPHVFFDF